MQILVHTPPWVFVLFIFLVFLGLQQSKDRSVMKIMPMLLPTGMVILSCVGVLSGFGLAIIPIGLWLVSLLVVAYVGATYFPVKGVTFNARKRRYFLKGSWVPFMLIMAIFFTKYLMGAVSALRPELMESQITAIVCSFVYGIFSGMFVARAISICRTDRSY